MSVNETTLMLGSLKVSQCARISDRWGMEGFYAFVHTSQLEFLRNKHNSFEAHTASRNIREHLQIFHHTGSGQHRVLLLVKLRREGQEIPNLDPSIY